MYLLVFTTLMISIIGLFTQVLALQTSRMAQQQNAFGSAMLQWHTAAVSMAVSILKTNAAAYTAPLQASGCSLTFIAPPNSGLALCPSPTLYGYGTIAQTGTVTTGPGTPQLNLIANQATGKNECVHLSSICAAAPNANGCPINGCNTSYDIIDYQFYSILYKDPTMHQNMVVTFLPAPLTSVSNPPPGNLSLVPVPGGQGLTGFVASDLLQQLNKAGAPNYSYGSFQGFPATPQLAVNGSTYNLPTGGFANLCTGGATCIANGGIAVIGSPDGF